MVQFPGLFFAAEGGVGYQQFYQRVCAQVDEVIDMFVCVGYVMYEFGLGYQVGVPRVSQNVTNAACSRVTARNGRAIIHSIYSRKG